MDFSRSSRRSIVLVRRVPFYRGDGEKKTKAEQTREESVSLALAVDWKVC